MQHKIGKHDLFIIIVEIASKFLCSQPSDISWVLTFREKTNSKYYEFSEGTELFADLFALKEINFHTTEANKSFVPEQNL